LEEGDTPEETTLLLIEEVRVEASTALEQVHTTANTVIGQVNAAIGQLAAESIRSGQDSPIGLEPVSNQGPIRCRHVLGGIIRDYYREVA